MKRSPCRRPNIGDLIVYRMPFVNVDYVGLVLECRGLNILIRWCDSQPLGYPQCWIPRTATQVISL